MRRNFAQVLREGKIDIKLEYTKLYALFYGKSKKDGKSMADIVSLNFQNYHFRGTCLDLEEFDKMHNIRFVEQPNNFDIDYLMDFCEYVYNFITFLNDTYFFRTFDKSKYITQILRVVEAVGYMRAQEDGFTIFVPKDATVIAVSESENIPDNVSYKIIAYNHHSLKGNIEGKKIILLKLAEILEGKRDRLKSIPNSVENDLFRLFNSCQIRHNNKDASIKGKYHKYIDDINDEELEFIYDEIYRMCLLAFMQLEHAERKEWLEDLKDKLINIK